MVELKINKKKKKKNFCYIDFNFREFILYNIIFPILYKIYI